MIQTEELNRMFLVHGKKSYKRFQGHTSEGPIWQDRTDFWYGGVKSEMYVEVLKHSDPTNIGKIIRVVELSNRMVDVDDKDHQVMRDAIRGVPVTGGQEIFVDGNDDSAWRLCKKPGSERVEETFKRR